MTNMVRTQTWCILAILIAGAAGTTAGSAQPPLGGTPVTSIVSDFDSGVALALQIQSDGLGYYTDSNTLTSALGTNGDWRLDALYKKGATRKISLSFARPVASTGPDGGDPIAPPSGLYTVNFGSNCSNFGNNILYLPAGQTIQCPMHVRFVSEGKTFDLRMNPFNYPGTNAVNVTCIFPTSGSLPCSHWRIQPSVTYTYTDPLDGVEKEGLRNVAVLSYETTVRGKTVNVKQGHFYISFSIILMK